MLRFPHSVEVDPEPLAIHATGLPFSVRMQRVNRPGRQITLSWTKDGTPWTGPRPPVGCEYDGDVLRITADRGRSLVPVWRTEAEMDRAALAEGTTDLAGGFGFHPTPPQTANGLGSTWTTADRRTTLGSPSPPLGFVADLSLPTLEISVDRDVRVPAVEASVKGLHLLEVLGLGTSECAVEVDTGTCRVLRPAVPRSMQGSARSGQVFVSMKGDGEAEIHGSIQHLRLEVKGRESKVEVRTGPADPPCEISGYSEGRTAFSGRNQTDYFSAGESTVLHRRAPEVHEPPAGPSSSPTKTKQSFGFC